MQNKVSTLITVSNTLFIGIMCFVWWSHTQKAKAKQWQPVKPVVHVETLHCGEKRLIYTNTDSKEKQLEFTFINNCTQPANTWVGQGDSVLVAGSSIIITRAQKIMSTYELKSGESFVAESVGDITGNGNGCEIVYLIKAEK